ncbi:hypothetical protein RclHR1_00590010 [Rhizophagus clarus]|uniref:BTB domain-containing protein n=1 Tax=Rhizophagus clarus TaxID=94130 RepID=A0A2Z6RQB2_9GLOM|nr:hypothetical protein RclHR1_00590010 [Rhizophagus clarus]GES92471.1 hypothetical protein GLOIN_2v1782772 [Rhizophagus clarus]
MTARFFPKLSQNYIDLLKDDNFYDIIIEVGEELNAKKFHAHKNILCYRSPYLQRILLSHKKNKDNVLTNIKLPRISPEVFHVILEYIYGGVLSLNERDTSDVFKILVAADVLCLQELVDYLQDLLIENGSEWVERNFGHAHQASFQSNNLLKLQRFCTTLMANSPEKAFKSFDFTSLSEGTLIQLIKRDDLQMKEIEVWEYVLKWGLAKNPTLIPDPDTWTDDDFRTMKITLQNCLPLIRFFSLSSKEFSTKVRPYKKLLNHQLSEDLIQSYMDPDSKPKENISPPRNIKLDGIFDSKIINLNIISIISRWIDKVDINDKFTHFRELYFPYEFQLLLRGSRDGFTPKKFHTLCDNKPSTATFIKIKGTDEIIGGYNPTIWLSSGGWGKTKGSFIFSFKNKNNFVEDINICYIENANYALDYSPKCGPKFGSDIFIHASEELKNYDNISCRKCFYEKGVRNTENSFLISDYEVFQIIK